MPKELHLRCQGVRHHLPERTRLRVPRSYRHPEVIENIEKGIQELESVKRVETNSKTGSILVHHEASPNIISDLHRVLSERAEGALDEMLEPVTAENEEVSILATLIGQTARKANRRFTMYTGNKVDLRTLLPLILTGVGLSRAASVERWWLDVPPYLFFYWAYDAFLRFHLHKMPEIRENGTHLQN